MKRIFSRLMLATLAITLGAAPAMAETTIGVINTQKLMRDSKAAQSVRAQMQSKQKAFQAELDATEKKLFEEDQALAKQQNSVEKEAFKKKIADFRERAAKAQREVQQKRLQVDKALAAALENIQQTVVGIVKEVAEEKKITVVLSSNQVLYADSALDLTDEVLQRLNKKLPNVTMKF